VALMSSGEFARTSGLTRKALRLYDELGLLTPARVDPHSGYRFYAPAQLEQARLVAWLRRLGMPLAAIRSMSTLSPTLAAAELAAYWDRVEAEAAARRELASFLIGYLSGKDIAMTDTAREALTVRYAVRSDIGLERADNEDAAYAGSRLLAVADGTGGHAAGEVASAAVIEALRPLDTQVPSGELLNALGHAVQRAEGALRDMVTADPSLRGMGTTVTALLRSGSRIGLAHIGDTRAYLVRDGEVAGDRYLLSSDGLHATVPADSIAGVLLTVTDPDQAAANLIQLAIDGCGPDNVTCIVADIVPAA
jgi:serine/threonine protein phosphatase PrpC